MCVSFFGIYRMFFELTTKTIDKEGNKLSIKDKELNKMLETLKQKEKIKISIHFLLFVAYNNKKT